MNFFESRRGFFLLFALGALLTILPIALLDEHNPYYKILPQMGLITMTAVAAYYNFRSMQIADLTESTKFSLRPYLEIKPNNTYSNVLEVHRIWIHVQNIGTHNNGVSSVEIEVSRVVPKRDCIKLFKISIFQKYLETNKATLPCNLERTTRHTDTAQIVKSINPTLSEICIVTYLVDLKAFLMKEFGTILLERISLICLLGKHHDISTEDLKTLQKLLNGLDSVESQEAAH